MNISRKLIFRNFTCGKTMTINKARKFNAGKSMISFKRFCNTHTGNTFDMAKEKAIMYEFLPKVIEDIEKEPKFEELPIAKTWLTKVVNGTLTGGKLLRGLTTLFVYKTIEKPDNMTEERIRLAYTLGWCNEILQAYCLLLDDIGDGSTTRRGHPCWYRQEDVGLAHATNDSVLLISCLHYLLRKNFENTPLYVKLCQAYNETLLYLSIGQHLDIKGSEHKNNYDSFTTENYDAIIHNKSSYYTYQLPITVGLMLANRLNAESLKTCVELSSQMGRLFQIQDDYIDCFGDINVTGKMGSDIQEGKCTWFAVNALSRCNTNTRAVFAACYGSKEPAHVERIKQLYIQLQLPQLYKQEENARYGNIKRKIGKISSTSEREMYHNILNMIYKRQK